MFIRDYIINEGVEFIDENSDFDGKDLYGGGVTHMFERDSNFLFVPVNSATGHQSMLISKFLFVGLQEYRDWPNFFKLNRNFTREETLKNHLNITGEYNLINKRYGTPPTYEKFNNNINVNNGTQNIEMKVLDFDNCFDWCGVFENAKEIHTVDTSLSLILTKMGLKNVSLYERVDTGPYTYTTPSDNYMHKDLFLPEWKIYTGITSNGFS